MEETTIQCPFCWQSISIMVDTSVSEQRYVEDCEVCCNPLEIHVLVEDSTINSIDINTL